MATITYTEHVFPGMIIMHEDLELEVLEVDLCYSTTEFRVRRLDGYGEHVISIDDYHPVEILAESVEEYLA